MDLKELEFRITCDEWFAKCKTEEETDEMYEKLIDLVDFARDEQNERLGVYDE